MRPTSVMLILPRTCLRFNLLLITRKPLLSPPIPERDFDPASLHLSDTSSETPSESPAIPDHFRNNHASLPPHALLSPQSENTAEDYLLPKAMATSSVRPSLSLVKPLSSPTDWIAESIYILRPLVYGKFVSCSGHNSLLTLAQQLYLSLTDVQTDLSSLR